MQPALASTTTGTRLVEDIGRKILSRIIKRSSFKKRIFVNDPPKHSFSEEF
jgi:hypothetical protein